MKPFALEPSLYVCVDVNRIYIVYNNEIAQLKVPNSAVIGVLALLGVAFAVVHAIYRFTTVFQLAFGTLASLCAVRLYLHYTHVKDPRARAVAVAYVRNSLIGVVFWMLDYHYCQPMQSLPVNPQGHAWCVTALLGFHHSKEWSRPRV